MSEGYTLKELVAELRSETKEQSTALTKICSTLEGIDTHLAQLNSKVAAHEKTLNEFGSFKDRALMVWSIVIFFSVTFVNKVLASLGL